MEKKKKVLLTGGTGFVGRTYVPYNQDKYEIQSESLRDGNHLTCSLEGVDTIMHLAGKAHQMQKIDPQVYFDVNYTLTKELADRAKAAGVPHFVFVSTIKAFGERQNELLTEDSPCQPVDDPYGESKLKAERYLQSITDEHFKVAIVRPPLIYGPAVKGNLIRFLKLGKTPWFLPFAKIENRRTMIFLNNFIELLNRITDLQASGLFLAGDKNPISTTKLIAEIRKNLGVPTRLFAMPTLFKKALEIAKPELAMRLYGSLEMDTSTTNKRLNFVPPFSEEEGIRVMVKHFITSNLK